ncbi:MAG: nucleotidyltransferase [Bacteroidota bacterium]
MNFTHPAHQDMLFALLEGNVEFILIGGYAVIYHGYVRTTADMDVWVKPTNENKEKLIVVFQKLRFDPEGVAIISKMDFSGVVVFHVGAEPDRIDFLSKVQGLNFDEAYRQKEILQVKAYQIPVLHLDDLIVSKLMAGRTKDKADVEYLIRINKR